MLLFFSYMPKCLSSSVAITEKIKNWTHHHRPYNYSIQSIDNTCVCCRCISVNRKKKRESILCVFSGGSTTCNFIQFSFLFECCSAAATTSPPLWFHTLFRSAQAITIEINKIFYFAFISHVIETNSYTWARSQFTMGEPKNRIYNKTVTLACEHVYHMFTAPRQQQQQQHKKNRVNFIAN